MIGKTISNYKVTSELGKGGMGEVWRAQDTKLGRDVALKVLPDSFAQDPDRLERFEREARVLASLSHPHIAGIHGLEDVDGEAELAEIVGGGEAGDGAGPSSSSVPTNVTLSGFRPPNRSASRSKRSGLSVV